MSKKGVVMYYDLLEQLKDFSDEQFGRLVRILLKYDKDGNIPEFNDMQLKLAFQMLKPSIDRNKEEYITKCETNRNNILKRWNKNDTNEYGRIGTNTMATDNDIDKDKDIKNDIIKEKKKKEKFTPPTLDEVKEYAISKDRMDLAEKFFEYFTIGKWIDSEGKKVKNWKQKFITWCNKNPKSKDNSMSAIKGREYSKTDYAAMVQSIDDIEL